MEAKYLWKIVRDSKSPDSELLRIMVEKIEENERRIYKLEEDLRDVRRDMPR